MVRRANNDEMVGTLAIGSQRKEQPGVISTICDGREQLNPKAMDLVLKVHLALIFIALLAGETPAVNFAQRRSTRRRASSSAGGPWSATTISSGATLRSNQPVLEIQIRGRPGQVWRNSSASSSTVSLERV